jgi:Flp pilus assembly pilin Flp
LCNLKKIFKNKSGVTAVEYGLISSLLGVAIIVPMRTTGFAIEETFECLVDAMSGSICKSGGFNGDIEKGWGTPYSVKAGRKYEITVPPGLQYSIWDDHRRWMNPDTNSEEHSLNGVPVGLAAIINDEPLPKPHVSIGGIGGSDNFNNYNNTAVFKNGKIEITAQKDGFLSVGLIDSNSFDNWTTTDGGATKSRGVPYTVTRVK